MALAIVLPPEYSHPISISRTGWRPHLRTHCSALNALRHPGCAETGQPVALSWSGVSLLPHRLYGVHGASPVGNRIPELLDRYPKGISPRMRPWSRDDNIWKRRSAIICEAAESRKGKSRRRHTGGASWPP